MKNNENRGAGIDEGQQEMMRGITSSRFSKNDYMLRMADLRS
jgi:hypothetical protein